MNASINAVAKRYRYTGKERDEETGLYYHGARYYIPWLCRWMACDPLEAKYAGMSAYNYGFNNPIKWMDADGMEPGGGDDPKPQNNTVKSQEDVIKASLNKNNVSPVDNTGSTPTIVPKSQPSFGKPASKLDATSNAYYFNAGAGWQESGLTVGNPFSPDALKGAGLLTAREAQGVEGALRTKINEATLRAEIAANAPQAQQAQMMQNPVYMSLYVGHQLNPVSSGVHAISDYSQGNYVSGTVNTLAAIGPFIKLETNLVSSAQAAIVSKVENIIKPNISAITTLDESAIVGYRGSLATGVKYKTGAPFDPSDFDVDAFIVSDELASKIGSGRYKSGSKIDEINKISNSIESSLKEISGYRSEPNKTFDFRVFTKAQFEKIVKPGGYKKLNP